MTGEDESKDKEQADDVAPKKRKRQNEDNDAGSDEFGFSPKTVKSMENMANFFVTMKKLFANPLQEAVENKVGGLAASVVERAFGPPTQPQNKDFIDTFLNSQMAFGIGQGFGSRAPELVESLSKSFGKEKAGSMIDSMIGGFGKGASGGVGIGGTGSGGANGGVSGGANRGTGIGGNPDVAAAEQRKENIDLLLKLDPNNPEHIAAYSESQGGLPMDVARKMMMIHQDAVYKQMGIDPQSARKGINANGNISNIGNDISGGINDGGINDGVRNDGVNIVEYRRPIPSPAQVMKDPEPEIVVPIQTAESLAGVSIVEDTWVDENEQQKTNKQNEGQQEGKLEEQQKVDNVNPTPIIEQDTVVMFTQVLQKVTEEITKLRSEMDEIRNGTKDSNSFSSITGSIEHVHREPTTDINKGEQKVEEDTRKENLRQTEVKYDINNQEIVDIAEDKGLVEDKSSGVHRIKNLRNSKSNKNDINKEI